MKKGLLTSLAIISFLVAFFLAPKSAYAVTFKVEKSSDTIKPGQDVTVSIKATDIGEDSLKSYNINLNYDASKLDYKSSSSDIANINPANPIEITPKAGTISSDTTVATIVFNAKSSAKTGDANLTLSSSNCITLTDKKITATNTSSMVKIVSYSSDATLSSLKIPNTSLSPKFDKNTLEYTTTITDITEVTVNAVASDSNSKIMISDNYKNLQKGENEIKISVTAEDGKTTKTYVVKVILKMTPTEEELTKADATLKSLSVTGYSFDFSKELKKYSITVPYKVTKVNVLAEASNEKAKIQMKGNTNFSVGRNVIKIDVTSEDEQNKEEYTITVNRVKQEKKVVQTCPDTTSSKEWIIFSTCMLLTFTLGIILGYFLCKKEVLKKLFKKKEKKEEIEEELSDTIQIPDLKNKKN